jgi:hypothetical protein
MMGIERNFRIFVVLALVGSLVLNFTLVSKMNQLEGQVSNISNFQHDITSSIDGQATQVYSALEEFKNEQSWISRITMNIDNDAVTNGQANAIFNWQVKELQKNSEVVFHYAFGESEEYQALPANEMQNGLFQVQVPFRFDNEPQWHVGLITSDSYHSEEASEKEAIDGNDGIHFYVTVSYDDMVKSSELQNEFLGDLRSSFYGIIQTDVHIFKSKLDITLINYQVDEKSVYVEKATLLKYKGDTLIGEEELDMVKENSPDFSERFFNIHQVEQYENIRLVMKVEYSNGDRFEKEIY